MYNWFSSNFDEKFLTFSSRKISLYRENANLKYLKNADNGKVHKDLFLNTNEELLIVQYYENSLRDFMNKFKPKNELLPKNLKATTFYFFKRFYLMSSVMDYHPKEMLMTCIFLACKVCEYIIPLDLFVRNIECDKNLLKNILVDQETELLYRLNFRLDIQSPHQFIGRILFELRNRSTLQRPERLMEHISRFLASMWFTDVCLLYTPPYIALAAVMHAVSRCKENIDDFVVNTLLESPTENQLKHIIDSVRDIRSIVRKWKGPPKKQDIIEVQKKLAICRNPSNNPASSVFKQRMINETSESHDTHKTYKTL